MIYGSPETTSGGNALKFYSSVRIDIRRISTIKGNDGEDVGIRVKVRSSSLPHHFGGLPPQTNSLQFEAHAMQDVEHGARETGTEHGLAPPVAQRAVTTGCATRLIALTKRLPQPPPSRSPLVERAIPSQGGIISPIAHHRPPHPPVTRSLVRSSISISISARRANLLFSCNWCATGPAVRGGGVCMRSRSTVVQV